MAPSRPPAPLREALCEARVLVKMLMIDGFVVSALKLECEVFSLETPFGLPRTEEGQCTARRRPTRRTVYHQPLRAFPHLRYASM